MLPADPALTAGRAARDAEARTRLAADLADVLRRAGRGAAISHESAAAVWSIELLEADVRRLTVPRDRSRLHLPQWQVVRSDLAPDSVVEVEGIRVTTALQTVRDLCRVLPFAPALVAADSAVRLGLVALPSLLADLCAARGRGCARLRRVGAAVTDRSESVLETLLRAVLLDAVAPPLLQHEVRDRHGDLVARVDLCWPQARLVVEADGFAFHSDRAAYRRDRERLNDLERLHWRTLRFTWEDVMRRPEHVVAIVADCFRVAA